MSNNRVIPLHMPYVGTSQFLYMTLAPAHYLPVCLQAEYTTILSCEQYNAKTKMYNNSMPISLDSILQVKPNTWTSDSYSGRNYVTKELQILSTEYEEITRGIRNQGITASISKIERVQHPFAYGRFLIRKEQLEKRNGYSTQPTRKFYRVSNDQIKEALEYNMDDRRATSITTSLYSIHDCCVVVVQRLGASKTRDSEEYPEYVVYFD